MTDERSGDSGGDAARIRPDRPARVPWGAVILYLVLACGLAWLVALPMWLSGGPDSPDLAGTIVPTGTVMMFTPAVAALVVTFALGVPRGERMRFLGLWPLRPAKRVVWFMVGAVFAPVVVVALVTLASSALGLVRLDLAAFSGFREAFDAQLAALDPSTAELARATMPPMGLLVLIQLLVIPFAAIINSFLALGEELGWRGWLLPALRPLGVWAAILISGVVWGLWHAPLILVGYNFGYTDWRGVALMVGGCVAWGALLGWARLRSASVWPAVIGHGALNASAGLVLLLGAAGQAPDLGLVGPLGIVAWAVIAVIVAILVLTGQFGREPELAPRRERASATPEPSDRRGRG